MILAVLASDLQKEEINASPFFREHELIFSENISLWAHHNADVFVDLCFVPDRERIKFLSRLLPKPVLVNAVTDTLDRIHPDLIRINAWPGFLKGDCLEVSAKPAMQEKAAQRFGEKMIFVNDMPGLVSARIVVQIINEAFFTWEAGTSTKDEIDIAMKLGTGYPYGPFEWAGLIGEKRVAELLQKLNEENPFYELAESMKANLKI
ncbi:MAG: 3-hydroxyacyl-CoA dehydrogenase family protein [Bacteroidota bacterium]|nr:3-hydroxyacyl-CoA dehydrogenase family protein [Bacteroidota bacterium]